MDIYVTILILSRASTNHMHTQTTTFTFSFITSGSESGNAIVLAEASLTRLQNEVAGISGAHTSLTKCIYSFQAMDADEIQGNVAMTMP